MAGNSNAGRKTTLTKEVIELVCGHIEGGLSNRDAAKLSGISETSFYEWISRGEKDKEKNKKTIYAEFADNIKASMVVFKAWNLQQIRNAAKQTKHWTAAAWLLERKFPEEFGKKLNIKGNFNVANYDIELTPEEHEEYKERMKNMYGEEFD